MWTPVINNVVVILVGLAFIVTAGPEPHAVGHLRAGEIALLGLGTTLGIVLQTAALIPSLRGSGSAGGRGTTSGGPRWPRSAG